MKNFILPSVALCLVLTGCELTDTRTFLGKTRSEAFSSTRTDDEKQDNPPQSKTDTVLYFAGVEVPDNYNWRKDTACGSAEAELILYRNYERIARIPIGSRNKISTDSDTHHLFGGKLYTEFTDLTRTYVKCNGEEIFSYEGRERLRGLVIRDSTVWTLGQKLSGDGFSLRKNGVAVFDSREGDVFGSLQLHPQGALYEDNGNLCFCYKTSASGKVRLFSVIDGKQTEIKNNYVQVHSMIVHEGLTYILASGANGKAPYLVGGESRVSISSDESIFEGYLLHSFNTVGVTGFLGKTYDNASWFIFHHSSLSRGTVCQISYIYPTVNTAGEVSITDGEVSVQNINKRKWTLEGRHYFFSRACASFQGINCYLALTPSQENEKPFIWINGKSTPVDINGFLSCIEIVIE